jgi:hypothetical protein
VNLYYYRARFYSASYHRFLSEDALEFNGGLNLYVYANANPVMYRDPTGLDAWLGLEGEVLLHFGLVGTGGGAGLLMNVGTWEICLYTMLCLRPGFGFIVSGGAKVNGSIFGPHCGKDLAGISVTARRRSCITSGWLQCKCGEEQRFPRCWHWRRAHRGSGVLSRYRSLSFAGAEVHQHS